VLSNEVLDNFSVHRVVMKDELMAIAVDYENGFRELLLPASDALKNYFVAQHITLPRDYATEVNLEAKVWIEAIAQSMHKGYVMTIDYGFSAGELYHPERKNGTLICFRKHAANENFYDAIGGQDITAHVNFSALKTWGETYGLQCCGYTSQARLQLSLGLAAHVRKMEAAGIRFSEEEKFSILHTMMMDMGTKFRALIQSKHAPCTLRGVAFSKPL
jgi:SAM-dependent MidA family methyltransferase